MAYTLGLFKSAAKTDDPHIPPENVLYKANVETFDIIHEGLTILKWPHVCAGGLERQKNAIMHERSLVHMKVASRLVFLWLGCRSRT